MLNKNTVEVSFSDFTLRLTGIIFERSDGKVVCPNKKCATCGKFFIAPLYLKRGELHKRAGKSFLLVLDSPNCHKCELRESVPLFTNGGNLAMRLSLRDERGEPYRWRDVKTNRWRAFPALNLRRLYKTKNIIANQPYPDRKCGRASRAI